MRRARTVLAAIAALGLCLTLSPSGRGDAATTRPWMNPALTPVERAQLLVQQMTLDEKILEIHMIDQPAHPREVPGIPRLGIPTFKITNGPAGAGPGDSPNKQPATALPSALGLSATSNTPSAHSIATIERPLAIPFLAYSALSAIICSGDT